MTALLAFACGKAAMLPDVPAEASPSGDAPGEVRILLGGAAAQTKLSAVNASDEARIERWAWWVFNGEGRAIHCGTGNGDRTTVPLMAGDYSIVVIANGPTTGSWAVPVEPGGTREELLGRITDLSVNAPDRFVMSGGTTFSVTGDGTTKVEVRLARLVAKVCVRKVSLSYDDPALAQKTTTLTGIYLTNLYRTAPLGDDYADAELSSDRAAWYNSMGWHRWENEDRSAAIDAMVGDRGLSHVLSASAPCITEHSFYCYPNPSRKENDTHDISAWSVRSSRLIIETDVDGTSYYYQVQIPPMKRNTPYVADEIIIRGLGSLDPEAEVTGALDVVFSTAVAGWEGVYNVNEQS